MSVAVRPWRKPGKFQVDIIFHKPDGQRVRDQRVIEAKTEGMARRWGEARENQLRAGTLVLHAEPAKLAPTFAEFVEKDWLPVYPKAAGNRHTTIAEKKSHLKSHLLPFFGEMRLDAINRKTMETFIAKTFEKTVGKAKDKRTSRNGYLDEPRPLSAKRVKNLMGTLHTILNSAYEWEVLAALPRFPQVKCPTRSFDFYDPTEAALLVASAREDEKALILFALHTGARAGEQLAVEWSDIDTRVHKFVGFNKSRTKGVTVQSTKSGKPRRVPLSPTLEAALKAHRHMRGPLVFCQEDGSHLTLWHLHGALDRAARKAGLRRLRWHDLRHSFASNLTGGGTPLRQVQEWMGHSTIMMTMRYAHLAPGGGREFLVALDPPGPRGAQATPAV
jgi:integrase